MYCYPKMHNYYIICIFWFVLFCLDSDPQICKQCLDGSRPTRWEALTLTFWPSRTKHKNEFWRTTRPPWTWTDGIFKGWSIRKPYRSFTCVKAKKWARLKTTNISKYSFFLLSEQENCIYWKRHSDTHAWTILAYILNEFTVIKLSAVCLWNNYTELCLCVQF